MPERPFHSPKSRRDLPLFRGQAERARAVARGRKLRSLSGMGLLALLALGGTLIAPPRPWLVWNASPSAPIGLYRVTAPTGIDIDDYVIAWLPENARKLAADRHYLPADVPLVKHVAAIDHDLVCAEEMDISINGRWVASRRIADPHGRMMPWWNGCHYLQDGEVFLFSEENADAFDGRYFGITTTDKIIGKAQLLWAR